MVLLALTACGGSGGGEGGSGPSTTDNLTALKVELASATVPNAGHQVSLNTTIRANREYQNLPVIFALVSKADLDAGLEEITVLFFGEDYVIAQVNAGDHAYNFIATVPLETREQSEWYLTPIIDPQEEFAESDETDNLLTEETVLLLTISDQNTDIPDVAVKDILFDDSMILVVSADDLALDEIMFEDPFADDSTPIAVSDIADFDFSASLELALTGSEPVSVGVYADLFMVIETVDLVSGEVIGFHGELEFPLLTWDWWGYVDPDTGVEYEPDYRYYLEQEIYPDEANFVDLEFLIPGANHDDVEEIFGDLDESGFVGPLNVRQFIATTLLEVQAVNARLDSAGADYRERVTFLVRIQIDDDNGVEDDSLDEYEDGYIEDEEIFGELDERSEDDSEIWLPLSVFVDAPDPALDSSGTSIPLQPGECRPLDYEKQFAKKWGGSFFGVALDIDNRTKVNGNEGAIAEFNASVPLTVFGQDVNIFSFTSEATLEPKTGGATSESSIRQRIVILGTEVGPARVTAAQANLPLPLGMTSKEVGGNKNILGGISLTATATMAYGLRANASIGGSVLNVGVGPYAEIQGRIALGADLGVFSGAIEGSVVLLKDSITANANAQLGAVSPDNKIPGTLAVSLVNDLSGPSGKIEAVGSISSCAGIDSVVNSIATAGECIASWFGAGSCGSTRVVSCPQAELFRTKLESFDSGAKKTDTLLQKNSQFRICMQ